MKKETTQEKLASFFFHLSGHHSLLPYIEIKSILESEKNQFTIQKHVNQLAIITTTEKAALIASERAAYCKRTAELLLTIDNNFTAISEIANSISEKMDFTTLIQPKQTYKVRVYRTSGTSKKIISIDLEKALGELIQQQTKKQCKVDIKNATKTFVVLLTKDKILLGREIYERKKGYFKNRRPDLRPFFKPGTLEPRFARLMVNLAQVSPGELFLDPFCGPGGILIEAALIGSQVIGIDLDNRMLKGAKKNLNYYTPKIYSDFIAADAKALPLKGTIKAIATDPPYGRSTSTFGKEIENLLVEFFMQARNLLEKDGIVAIGMFQEVPLKEIGEKNGFELLHLEKLYIHRSLTRNIGVFRKK